MRITKKIICTITTAMFAVIVITGCGDKSTGPNDPPDPPINPNIAGDSTAAAFIRNDTLFTLDGKNVVHVMDSQFVAAKLASVSMTRIVFNDAVTHLAVGDIIVSGVTESAPNGFFAKVKAVSTVGAVTTIETEPAALTDVFHSLIISEELDMSNPVVMDYDADGNLVEQPSPPGMNKSAATTAGGSVAIQFSAGFVTLTGSASVNAAPPVFASKISGGKFEYITYTATCDFAAQLSGTIAGEGVVNNKKRIKRFKGPSKTFVVPVFGIPVPIVVAPKVDVGVHASANGRFELTADLLNVQNTTTVGLKYSGAGWDMVHESTGWNNTAAGFGPLYVDGNVHTGVFVEPGAMFYFGAGDVGAMFQINVVHDTNMEKIKETMPKFIDRTIVARRYWGVYVAAAAGIELDIDNHFDIDLPWFIEPLVNTSLFEASWTSPRREIYRSQMIQKEIYPYFDFTLREVKCRSAKFDSEVVDGYEFELTDKWQTISKSPAAESGDRVEMSAEVGGLDQDTKYYVRRRFTNFWGTYDYDEDPREFTTGKVEEKCCTEGQTCCEGGDECCEEIPQELCVDCTVTFVGCDGTVLKIQPNIGRGNGATAPAYSAPSGYTFVRWDKDFSAVTENLVVTAICEEVVGVSGRWEYWDSPDPETGGRVGLRFLNDGSIVNWVETAETGYLETPSDGRWSGSKVTLIGGDIETIIDNGIFNIRQYNEITVSGGVMTITHYTFMNGELLESVEVYKLRRY